MKIRHAIILAVTAALGFAAGAGCARSSRGYTVDYFMQNDMERNRVLEECANDPGSLRDDPLCINAQKAGAAKAIGSLRDPPALSLVEAQELREKEQRSKSDIGRQHR